MIIEEGSKIHRKMRTILDRKMEVLSETGRIDPDDAISLSRLKHRYNQLDKEYAQLKWQLYKSNET